jgi:hypothetical protein
LDVAETIVEELVHGEEREKEFGREERRYFLQQSQTC